MIDRFIAGRHAAGPIMALMMLCSSSSIAQTTGAEFIGPIQPDTALTLDRAVYLALERNFEIRLARSRVTEAGGRLQHNRRLVPSNPELEFSIGDRDPQGPGASTTDLGIRLAQEIWIGGQGGLQRRAARSRLEGARAAVGFLETTIAARARSSFLDLLVAQSAVDTAVRAVAVTTDIMETAQARLDSGEATRMEVNTAGIGLGRARSELAAAHAQRNLARTRLAELMAVELPDPTELEGEFETQAISLPPRTRFLNKVAQQRQDLAAAAAEVAAAQQELKLSRRQLIPNLTVFGFYEQEEDAEIIGAGLSLPLPVLHRYSGERTEAGARLEQAGIERDALLLQIRLEVDQAVADYRAARKRIEAVTEAVLRSAEQNVELTYAAFRAGQVGVAAIASSQETLLQARRDFLDAQRAMVRAAGDLERATGGLLVLRGSKPKASIEVDATESSSSNTLNPLENP